MSRANPKLDRYFKNTTRWKDELTQLRGIALGSGLEEQMKWGKPCYVLDGANVVLIHEFKDYCALLFFKGALLKDPKKILVQQTANVQAGRQIRFTNSGEITKLKATLKTFIDQAIAVEKSGVQVPKKTTADFPVADEFQAKLDASAALKKAFAALTPGRQRGYLLHFAGAKQSSTRQARVEKHLSRILSGKGLDDE